MSDCVTVAVLTLPLWVTSLRPCTPPVWFTVAILPVLIWLIVLSFARTAGVPIVPARIHYPHKRVTIGAPLPARPDLSADMDVLRRFYEAGAGKNPDQASRVWLREEDEEATGPPAT